MDYGLELICVILSIMDGGVVGKKEKKNLLHKVEGFFYSNLIPLD